MTDILGEPRVCPPALGTDPADDLREAVKALLEETPDEGNVIVRTVWTWTGPIFVGVLVTWRNGEVFLPYFGGRAGPGGNHSKWAFEWIPGMVSHVYAQMTENGTSLLEELVANGRQLAYHQKHVVADIGEAYQVAAAIFGTADAGALQCEPDWPAKRWS